MPVQKYEKAGDPAVPLATAKEWFRLNLRAPGVICPCCAQMAAMRKRNFNSTMAQILILIYRHQIETGDKWVHVEQLLRDKKFPTRGDFYKLKYWKLLEQRPASHETGNPNTGYFTVTERGVRFATCRIRLASFAWVYRDRVEAWSTEKVNIKMALGKGFNYRDLMEGK